jgi:hypothetical protein
MFKHGNKATWSEICSPEKILQGYLHSEFRPFQSSLTSTTYQGGWSSFGYKSTARSPGGYWLIFSITMVQ